MNEQAFFFSGAVFLVLLSVTIIRLGRAIGGAAWAWAWVCLYGSGIAISLSPDYPALSPLVPALSTAFSTFFVGGTLLFSGRVKRIPRQLILLGGGVAVLRIAIQPFVSVGVSQLIGSLVISAAVLACSVILLRPPDREPTTWERILAMTFPIIALVSAYNASVFLFDFSAPPTARYWWLLVSISIGFLQISAMIAHATERIESLGAEAARSREAHAAVSEEYRQVTDQANDMITELDESGVILYANPSHEGILGFEVAKLIGQPFHDLVPIEHRSRNASVLKGLFGIPPHLRHVVVRRRDGVERTLECNIQPFTSSSGNKRIVVTSRDVTDRVAAERVLKAGREQLETLVEERTVALQVSLEELERSQRLASIGTLAAGIAHQINNPIGSVQMSAEFALHCEGNEDEREIWRESLVNGVDQARRCGQIVANILQFARNEPTAKSEEDLTAILRRVCDQVDDYARSQSATLDTSAMTGPLPIFGSAIELEQALLNIIRNAAESSAGSVDVKIGAARKDGFAQVTISDNGVGMEVEDLARAFDPFFTTRLGGGGTGLGLSVAHGVVTDHGGMLSVESKKNVGTTMTLSLPLSIPGKSA